MDKWKIVETVLLAATTFIAAVKSVVKFIGYITKLRQTSDECFVG